MKPSEQIRARAKELMDCVRESYPMLGPATISACMCDAILEYLDELDQKAGEFLDQVKREASSEALRVSGWNSPGR